MFPCPEQDFGPIVWEQQGERKTKSTHRKKTGECGSLEEFTYFVHSDVRVKEYAFETHHTHIQKMLRLTSSVKWIVIKGEM